MKILLVNNFHYSRGGAERAYFDLGKILEEQGHSVAYFSTANEKNIPTKWSKYFPAGYDLEGRYGFLKSLKIAGNFLYNFSAKKNIQKLIKEFQPDIVHLHNIYHHLSPSIIDGIKKFPIPIVMTLHDYKLICPERTMYAHGHIWERSKKKKYYLCLVDKCVKNSYPKSLLASVEAYLHDFLGTYRKIDVFISPSKFLANKFKEFGFEKDIICLPNPLVDVNFDLNKENKYSDYLLYFGRLTEEKGIMDVVGAYKEINTKTKLLIVGDGPQKQELENEVKNSNISEKVIFTTHKNGHELWTLVSGAKAVIFPSKWYENYPYSILEPMLLTRILICAKMGGISEIIDNGKNGFLYELNQQDESQNILSLKEKINYVLQNEERLKKIGEEARKSVLEKNDKEKYYSALINIYEKAIRKEKR